jgi:Mrp family chromosome partitioning ATPase
MNAHNVLQGVNSDRVDAGLRQWPTVVASAAVGIIVGVMIGGFYGASKPVSYQATMALSVLPDSTVINQAAPGTPALDAASFIQSQLVIFNGGQLAQKVQNNLALRSRPNVSSTEIGQTYVVQITATAADSQQAVAIATMAGTAYAAERSAQLTAEITGSLTSTTSQLTAAAASLAAARSPASGVTPAETALQSQYQQLLSQSSALQLALPQVGRVVSVLSPASVSTGSLSTTTKDRLAGALVGALLGLAFPIALRRLVPRLRTIGDIAALGVPVLLPVLPAQRLRPWRRDRGWPSSAGRLLGARLISPSSTIRQPLIVVGATRRVGASFVAASLAAGLAERGSVLLVQISELVRTPSGGRSNKLGASPHSRMALAKTPNVGELMDHMMPSVISGVWLLPCDSHIPPLAGASPSARAALLADMVARAAEAGWLVVVDAPALSESDLALDCAAVNGVVALVVGRGVSRPADVLIASELFEVHGNRLAGAILNSPAPRLLGLGGRSSVSLAATRELGDAIPSRPTEPRGGRRRADANGGPSRADDQMVTLPELMSRVLVSGSQPSDGSS